VPPSSDQKGPLSTAFLSRVRQADNRFADTPNLEELLEAALATAKAAYPEVALADELYVGHLAERMPPEGDGPKALASVQASDLYIACACALGDARAIAVFDKRYASKVAEVVARLDKSTAFIDEAQQAVRQKLFMSDGEANPKIAEYSGKGSLVNWLRAVAMRTALNLRRGAKEEVSLEDQTSEDLPLGGDPELDYLKDRYKKDFKEAFGAALASLSSQEVNVLKLHLIDGLNIDKIGALYNAHRSTVARWIARARETLLSETRRTLADRLRLTPSELDSMIGFVQSQLDLSIARYLKAR
jgi:RNA polymerase sigma-70 factor (ECF subfamily)